MYYYYFITTNIAYIFFVFLFRTFSIMGLTIANFPDERANCEQAENLCAEQFGRDFSFTRPETNIAPEIGWLED